MGPTLLHNFSVEVIRLTKFNIKFVQHIEGVENCEATIEAIDKDEALQKLWDRRFTTYIVRSSDVTKEIVEDYVEDLEEVG